ncbi:hypothetical protein UY3_12911 [Chelonia mydas]|uniref:Uncharacterized protein n=1 Tax=Chelonia mydas TaxID=8469 RepID=M7BP68_CHEMY|nr:hypothetical protein UY3_12911 [Chelonia mydas]
MPDPKRSEINGKTPADSDELCFKSTTGALMLHGNQVTSAQLEEKGSPRDSCIRRIEPDLGTSLNDTWYDAIDHSPSGRPNSSQKTSKV